MRLGDDFGNPYRYVQKCYDEKFVGVYYFIEKDLTKHEGKEFEDEFKKECDKNLPNDSKKDRKKSLDSRLRLFRLFCKEIEIGDIMLCPENNDYSSFFVGKITSDCYFNEGEGLVHRRKIEWYPTKLSLNDISKIIKLSPTIVEIKDNSTLAEIKKNYPDMTKQTKETDPASIVCGNYDKGDNSKSQEHRPNSILIKKSDLDIDKETIINKAFKLILPSLVVFIRNTLMKYGKNDWWKKYIYDKLNEIAKKNLPEEGSFDKLIEKLDISACLHIIINNWDDIFKNVLGKKQRDCAHGLLTIRNDDSHFTLETISTIKDEDLEHALILIIQLMRPINPDIANQISEIRNELNHPQNT
jgi:hypothetical protein